MQSFTPTQPAFNSLAVSQLVRDNFNSLLSSQAGASLPGYAVAGMPWYDSTNKLLKVIKERGSKAYKGVAAGPDLTVFASIRAIGTNGAAINIDVRVQNSVLIPSGNHDWTQVAGPVQRLYFLNTKVPSQFAATFWNDPLINDPVIVANDGVLLGKTWETLVGNENVYYTGPMQNETGYAASTLRAVNLEQDPLNIRINFSFGALNDIDHQVFPLTTQYDWSDFQESGGEISLLENGVELPTTAYKATFFMLSGVPQVVVYRIATSGLDLTPFSSLGNYILRIRKPS
jgi:hypothetical protein